MIIHLDKTPAVSRLHILGVDKVVRASLLRPDFVDPDGPKDGEQPTIEPGAEDDVAYLGFEVAGAAELAEVGVFETRVQMRLYLADFAAAFHDLRNADLDPNTYAPTQQLAKQLLDSGSDGVIYRSVRDAGGECIACFRARLVANVRPDAHFEYRWTGTETPSIHIL